MKKITFSSALCALFGTLAMAGGDYAPVSTPTPSPMSMMQPAKDSSGIYMGIGYSYLNSKLDNYKVNGIKADGKTDTDANGGLFAVGYQYNDFIGVEARYTTQIIDSDDSGPVSNQTGVTHAKEKAENIGLYLKPQYKYDRVTAYGLLGYGWVRGKIERNNRSASSTEGGFQWGLGLAFNLSEHTSLFADYTDFADVTVKENVNGQNLEFDSSSNNYTVGLAYKF